MRNLRKKNRQSGFSLVELMVSMVIVSILSLTLGTMLIYIFKSWRNSSDQVELQRDITFAMDMFTRAIRPASFSQVQIPNASTLVVGTKRFYLVAGTDANSLFYDPDTTVAGGEIELLRDRVTSLQFANNTPVRSISIDMSLLEGRETIVLNQMTVSYRN